FGGCRAPRPPRTSRWAGRGGAGHSSADLGDLCRHTQGQSLPHSVAGSRATGVGSNAMGENTPPPEATGRQLFELRLHSLSREQRIELARTCTDERLEALCFDPDPGTVTGVLDNPLSGLAHARL